MNPGIYYNIPFAEYQTWPGVHQSMLKNMNVPARAKYQEENPKEPTAAMELGTALHCKLLEPDRFASEYVVAPKLDKRSKEWKEFAAKHEGKLFISKEVCGMEESLFGLNSFGCLIHDLETRTEVSAVWVDESTGITCKARFDLINQDLKTVVELKTTRSASPEGFAAEVFKNAYHIQAAFYRRGLKALGAPCGDFLFFAVENLPPHLCAAYRLIEEVLEVGDAQVTKYLKVYDECSEFEQWPGYSNEILPIGIPTWGMKQIMEAYGEQ